MGNSGDVLVTEIASAARAVSGSVLVGLDRTGVNKGPLPSPLDADDLALEASEYWASHMETPLDSIHPGDLEVVVTTFLAAIETGYATCSVRAEAGRPMMLQAWNLLARHGVVAILAVPLEALDAEPDPFGPTAPKPAPLRLVQHVTVHGLIASIDDATREVLGWGDEVIGRSRLEFQDALSNESSSRAWSDVLAYPSRSFRGRIRLRAADGSWRWFDTTSHNRLATEDVIVVEHIDITEHMDGAPTLNSMYPLADYLAALAPDGILCVDETGLVLAWNERFTQLTRMSVDATTRRLLPAPQVVAEPFRRIVRAALADRTPRVHDAFVSHAQHRLRLSATLVPLTLDRRCCVVLVDENLAGTGASSLPKGLSPSTLERVVATLAAASEPRSVPALAEAAGLSPVSIRRYLSFLVQNGEVVVHRSYGRRGRPSQTYSLASA